MISWGSLAISVYIFLQMYFVRKRDFVGASILRLQEELRGERWLLNIRYVILLIL